MISDTRLQGWVKDTDAANLTELRGVERAAVAAIQKQTGRYIGIAVASFVEIIRFKGWPIVLANEPTGGVITTLESWDGSAWSVVDATSYYLNGSFIWQNTTSTAVLTTTEVTRYRATYPAGYAGAVDTWAAPADIEQAVLLLTGHWYENREAGVVGTITADLQLGLNWILQGHKGVAV